MYKLLIEDDEGGKTAVSLIRDEITIGRKEGNTIRLTERNVSRRHGRIVREDDRVFVEEVSARYGIKKNGKRIKERAELKEGDVILIGDYRLTLQADTKGKKLPTPQKVRAPGSVPAGSATELKSIEELKAGAPSAQDFSDSNRENTQIMQALPAKLVVISSNFAGEEFPLHQKEMVIGRGDDCHIIIDHRSISSKHAKIVREDNTSYKIVDLNSKNGVKVSGDTYRATHLKRGDVVELGHVKFRFVEPGENYVFTPQAAAAAAAASSPAAKKGGIGAGAIIGAVVVAALVIAAGLFVISTSDSEPSAGEAALLNGSEVDSAARELEELEVGDGEDRITVAIAGARAQIEDGQLQRAMGTLELLQTFDPSASQASEIDELMATARNELPFMRSYESALEALDNGDHMSALERIASIPSHSLFHARMEEENLFDEIFGTILDMGRDAIDEGKFDEAKALADEVLLVRSDYGPANELVALAETRKQAAEEEARARREARAQASASRTDTSSPRPQPAQQRLSAEQARELFTSAARKVTSGDPQGAVTDCTQALRAGHSDCHRILGVAYGQMNQTAQACNHYRQYLRTGPRNASAIESQMERLGCD